MYGTGGVLQGIEAFKGFVELTGIDSVTSLDFLEVVSYKEGRYLEAQIQGSKREAELGTLVILAAGDHGLYEDCQSAFQAMGALSFFLGK